MSLSYPLYTIIFIPDFDMLPYLLVNQIFKIILLLQSPSCAVGGIWADVSIEGGGLSAK